MADTFSFFEPATWPAFAPYNLSQDILRGWSFLTINETNSSAPDVERRVVATESYGRQLGKLTDAVAVLIERSEMSDPAFAELMDLRERVEKAKAEAKADRLKHLAADLKALKDQDPQAFDALVGSLRP